MKTRMRKWLLVALMPIMMLVFVIGVTLGTQVVLAGVESLDAGLDRG